MYKPLLAAIITLASGRGFTQDDQVKIVFSDDFNRTSSPTVGNNWSEFECCSGADVQILDGRLTFATTDGAPVFRDYEKTAQSNNQTLLWTYIKGVDREDVVDGVSIAFNHNDRNVTDGLSLIIDVGAKSISIFDKGEKQTTEKFPLEAHTEYYFQWNISSEYKMRVWVWKKFSPLPTEPVLELESFSPQSTKRIWAIGNRFHGSFDNFIVLNPMVSEVIDPKSIMSEFIRGDTNGDNDITIADPIAILGYLFLGETAVCHDALDVDDDGVLNITDAIYLLNFMFFGSKLSPAKPFPNTGIDPTLDQIGC